MKREEKELIHNLTKPLEITGLEIFEASKEIMIEHPQLQKQPIRELIVTYTADLVDRIVGKDKKWN